MQKPIHHKGIVTAVGRDSITVAVSPGSRCDGCGIALVCSSKGDRVVMDVPVGDPGRYHAGQEVELIASSDAEWRALWLGMALPCLLLLCSVMGLLWLGAGPSVSAVSGMVVIAIYYLILYIFRKKVSGSVRWEVAADGNG